MARLECQRAAKRKYTKTHINRFVLEFNKKTDADLWEFLYEQPNKTRYLKDLIAKDMAQK